MTIQHLFTTPIKIVEMPNFIDLNIRLGKAIKAGFKNNFTDNLPEEEKKSLQKIFIDEAELYLKESINKNINLSIYKSWINQNQKYGFDSPHSHGATYIVAVYYIKTFDKCGDLLLHDPRGCQTFTNVSEINTQGSLVDQRNFYRITPKIGNLILFPAYVIHSVEPNMSEEIRISLAINFKYENFNQFKPD
jgi:uncharacterized protein (TIGR02466 family)